MVHEPSISVLVVCVFASANCTARRTPLEHRMSLRAFINSPTGPKTTHFWGPVANWGFVVAGLADTSKPEHMISGPMTGALVVYSGLFMRFAWRVQPRNYILLACHTANANVQAYNLSRWAMWKQNGGEEAANA